MALGKDEWRRRLKAALELRGLEMQELAPRIAELKDAYDVAAHSPARATYPKDPQVPTEAMAKAVAAALDLPREWFLVENFDAWLTGSREATADDLGREIREIRRVLGAVAGALGVAQVPPRPQPEPVPRTDSAREGGGSG